MPRKHALLFTVSLFLGLVGCDHASKHTAERTLRGQPDVPVVAGVVDLRYSQNPGVAFSLERFVPESVRAPLLYLAGFVALGAIAIAWRRRRAELSPTTIAYALVAAGAVGNLVDRIARGYVVDFIHVHHWPIFNVADICIVAGVMLLTVSGMRTAHR